MDLVVFTKLYLLGIEEGLKTEEKANVVAAT